MTIDFLIGAIRASRDLHPQVQTELEEILRMVEKKQGVLNMQLGLLRKSEGKEGRRDVERNDG